MRLNNFASRLVIHGRFQILNERPAAPHVQRLRAVADGEDRLAMVECVLKKNFVSDGAGGVVRCGFSRGGFAVERRIDVVAAARQKNAVYTREELCDAFARIGERYDDRLGAGGLDGFKILRQRARVVFGIVACGLGDGDARGHGTSVVRVWVCGLRFVVPAQAELGRGTPFRAGSGRKEQLQILRLRMPRGARPASRRMTSW